MKVKVKYKLYSEEETIDLEDYGHFEKKWDDLTDNEKIEIKDALLIELIPEITFEDVD